MQYLHSHKEISPHINRKVVNISSIPYSMDLVPQLFRACSKTNECFDDLEFFGRTGLKPARVMKDEARVGGEDQLIIHIMIAALEYSEIASCPKIDRAKGTSEAHFRSRR